MSTVDAARTPIINAAMVLCDRHYGGINYPKGGVGRIALELTQALEGLGGRVEYRANVKEVVVGEDGRAVGPPTPPTKPLFWGFFWVFGDFSFGFYVFF